MVEIQTVFLVFALYPFVSSSREKPVIKVKYAGIKGNTHGEKKDNRPAKKATGYETVSTNIFYTKFI